MVPRNEGNSVLTDNRTYPNDSPSVTDNRPPAVNNAGDPCGGEGSSFGARATTRVPRPTFGNESVDWTSVPGRSNSRRVYSGPASRCLLDTCTDNRAAAAAAAVSVNDSVPMSTREMPEGPRAQRYADVPTPDSPVGSGVPLSAAGGRPPAETSNEPVGRTVSNTAAVSSTSFTRDSVVTAPGVVVNSAASSANTAASDAESQLGLVVYEPRQQRFLMIPIRRTAALNTDAVSSSTSCARDPDVTSPVSFHTEWQSRAENEPREQTSTDVPARPTAAPNTDAVSSTSVEKSQESTKVIIYSTLAFVNSDPFDTHSESYTAVEPCGEPFVDVPVLPLAAHDTAAHDTADVSTTTSFHDLVASSPLSLASAMAGSCSSRSSIDDPFDAELFSETEYELYEEQLMDMSLSRTAVPGTADFSTTPSALGNASPVNGPFDTESESKSSDNEPCEQPCTDIPVRQTVIPDTVDVSAATFARDAASSVDLSDRFDTQPKTETEDEPCEKPSVGIPNTADVGTKPFTSDAVETSSTSVYTVVVDSGMKSEINVKPCKELSIDFPVTPKVLANSTPVSKNKRVKNTTALKRKRTVAQEFTTDMPVRKTRVAIPSSQTVKISRGTQTTFLRITDHCNNSLSNVSNVSANVPNVVVAPRLPDTPDIIGSEEQREQFKSDFSNKMLVPGFEGVFAFVDYKDDYKNWALFTTEALISIGAKIQKTFSHEVTHVMFCHGSHLTYKTAIERNIPLVSGCWVYECVMAKKIVDVGDYLVGNLEKYTKETEERKCISCESFITRKTGLFQENIDLDEQIVAKFGDINECCKNILKSQYVIENSAAVDITVFDKKFDSFKITNIMNALIDELCRCFNNKDSTIPNEQKYELYLPKSISLIKKYFWPKGIKNKKSIVLNMELTNLEARLNLNIDGRRHLRRLLFPYNSALHEFVEILPSVSYTENENEERKEIIETSVIDIPECLPSALSDNSSTIAQTSNNTSSIPAVLQGIACSGFYGSDLRKVRQYIQDLGTYSFNQDVEPFTKYLITNTKNRNHQKKEELIKTCAMAFGCLIVSDKWLDESVKKGVWLSHENYLIANQSNLVKEFQKRRHKFGAFLTFHIFDNVKPIHFSKTCQPSALILRKLVEACGGKCTTNQSDSILVGSNVSVDWIFDSIACGSLLDINEYNM